MEKQTIVPEGLSEAEAFFYENAGFSYSPSEGEEIGHISCAKELAKAEEWAKKASVIFDWQEDDEPAEYQDEEGAWHTSPAVVAIAKLRGRVIASLGGIIESENAKEAQKYRRVVEAELASEGRDHIPAIIKECEKEAEAFRQLLEL